MPIYEFEEMPVPKEVEVPDYVKWQPEAGDMIQPVVLNREQKKLNFWGYGPGNYFAVKSSYASEPVKANVEFKRLVKSLHENGMECVLEFFFPWETNYNLILDVLHFWVKEYHVDGFHLIGPNLPITAIVQDPVLSRTKIFAEEFWGQHDSRRKYKNLYVYKEEYQFAVRQLINHYDCDIREFANQQRKQGEIYGFVNFLASNNGFTLADCFMYNDKHNMANGEDNRDGNDYNLTNNYGVEGPTRKKFVNEVRRKQMRMALTMLMFAQGVPLIMAGDEFGNTQYGNNNAYCQDNEIGWVNWSQFAKYKEERALIKSLIEFRKKHTIITKDEPFRFNDYRTMGAPDFSYHGENAWISQLDPGRRSLGMLYYGAYAKEGQSKDDIYVGYNFYSDEVKLALPILSEKKWTLDGEELEEQQYVTVPAHSIRVLKSKDAPKPVVEIKKARKS
jgi:glycogen operon protein